MQFATPSETQLTHSLLTFLRWIRKEEENIGKQVFISLLFLGHSQNSCETIWESGLASILSNFSP